MDYNRSVTRETIQNIYAEIRKAPGSGGMVPADIIKAINQNTGLVWYDLEPYAKLLFPVITPLRNEIPRVAGDGGISTHWVSITGINANNVSIGVGEGHRGGSVTTTVTQNLATYKTFGLDDSVTFEADLAAKNLDDAKALSVENLLRAVMIGEEQAIVGANSSVQLGTTPTPTVADVATGGGLAPNLVVSVICVALSYDGFLNSSVTGGVPAQITRTNTDGTTEIYGGGSARKSAAAAVTTANDGNSTHIVTATTGSAAAGVSGALGYAWYWGLAGAELLGAITTTNSLRITGTATGTQTAASMPAADNSTNALLFDGLFTQIFTSGSNAQVSRQATLVTASPTNSAPTGQNWVSSGTPLTADGAGGVTEIDSALKAFWDNFRLSPQCMLVNSQELLSITKKAIAGGSAPLFRFALDGKESDGVSGMKAIAGTVVGSYLNKFTMAGGQLVQVLLHPNVPPGTIMFYSRQLPYPLTNVRNLLQMKLRRDYFQIEWPTTRPAYEFTVWANGVLQNFFPPAFGAITNIAAG